MPEEKEKKAQAPDYSATAINLCNPEAVKAKYAEWNQACALLQRAEAALAEATPELCGAVDMAEDVIKKLRGELVALIKEHGSYQDVEKSEYALIYAAKTAEYQVTEDFKSQYPKLVPLCVEEAINVASLKGCITGKHITEAELFKLGVITYKTKEVPVIK